MNSMAGNDPRHNLIKVAAAQIDGAYGDVGANLARHLGHMEQARASGVRLLVFPELSLCGHSAGKDALRLAMTVDDPVIATLAEASTNLHTVFGFIEEAPGAQFYNSQATVSNGKVVHVHRKAQLATYGKLRDGLYYAAGTVLGSFPLNERWRMATPICADLWNPALVHALACDGVTLIAAPISSAREAVGEGFDNPAGWDVNLRFHAMTYGVGIVMANRVGTEGMMTFWGGSRILDPFGKTVALGSETEEGLVIGELDYESVRRARFLLPTVRDARAFALRESAAKRDFTLKPD
ncbi:nitrilase-related carbon-nitrogen hydrolase [Paraburkholderia sartisoli]|uniref:Predicted amidohydrolase n=1 Tax=Paraburkholderia sartisoli TaxID=83784 RepID=A0A1H4F090_9BURK|nr:nitrilase-related carbon-nitrogen hydrolase [Paraburkholderia sartisoli]SEA90621.1 Predicted amidohydrolase [Paraburkholderia sartisoli]